MRKPKVGILTFPNSPSFGASLQMYGMFYALKAMGIEPEVINYINPYMKEEKHIVRARGSQLKKMLLALNNYPVKRKFRCFEKQLVLSPKKPLSDPKQLPKLAEQYDRMVCGSDQVWNPHITGSDASYFFDFCLDDSKKVAYAPSFGINALPEAQKAAVAAELKKFAALSVREQQGQQIVRELTGRDCPVVVDPSMLLERRAWLQIARRPRRLPERYIVYFIFNPVGKVGAFADQLSKQTGLQVITIGGGLLSRLRDPRSLGTVGPDEWLYIMANAEHVITDSFHGAAFSIIFERSLFVSMASATNSRLATLMHTFRMEDRIIGDQTPEDIVPTDYQKVGKIMQQKREEGLAYLRRALLPEA